MSNTLNARIEVFDAAGTYERTIGHRGTVFGEFDCTDCHESEGAASQGGVRGPHGSIYEPILAREYQTLDRYPESAQSYALCYRCHDRNTLLADRGGFPHRRHVVEREASCATCHDAHGSRRNTHLINFMTRDRDGREVVTASRDGVLEFLDLGRSAGQCSLTCHGANHDALAYR